MHNTYCEPEQTDKCARVLLTSTNGALELHPSLSVSREDVRVFVSDGIPPTDLNRIPRTIVVSNHLDGERASLPD